MEVDETYFPFEELGVYSLALDFAAEIYRVSEGFANHERFGLTNQMRRAAVSISLNSAEGRGRGTDREFIRFLMISRGRLFEVISASQIAHRLHYLTADDLAHIRQQAKVLSAKLMALIKCLGPVPSP
ncbi:four helix bundle protein [Deinococcus frigens]|uniref:four helix bundle protein n=1 Tax=Deinococcus frigens TaxID=249403 RepID=UPI000497F0CF|nr:four helix bundle protein [Deinococcus frigens]